jgi:hypothetical protein
MFSKTRFRVNGGGYSVLVKPFLTQKRGVVDFDWTFFTVMQLVACQLTMEQKYHWLLYWREPEIESSKVTSQILQNPVPKERYFKNKLKYGGGAFEPAAAAAMAVADVAAAAAVVAAEKAVEAAIATLKSAGAARATSNSAWAAREKAAAVAAAVDVVRAVAAAAVHSCSGSGCLPKT